MLTRTQRKPKKTEERWETCFSYHEADAYLYAFKESRSKTSSKEGGRQVVRTRRVLEWRTGEVTGNLCVGLELEKFLAGGRREWPDIHTKRRSRGSKCASWATTNEVKEGMKILRARGSFIVGRHRKDVIARSPPVVPGLTPRGFGDGPAEWRIHIGTRADRSSGGSKRGLVITVVADIVPAMWNIGSWARDGLGISRTVSGRNRNKLRRRLKVQGRCRHAQELFSRRTGSRWLEGGGRRKIKEWILCLWGFERWQGSLAFLAVRRKRITELGEFQLNLQLRHQTHLNFAFLGRTMVFLSVISTELSNGGCCSRGRGLFCCCERWSVGFGLERESSPGVWVGCTMSVGGAEGCLRWLIDVLCW